jgi:hypothetical protein
MSTDLNFTRAIRLLSDLNIISQSSHPSDANIEFMERQLAEVISTMVSNNRDRAYERSIYADNIRRAIAGGRVTVRRPSQYTVPGPYTAPLYSNPTTPPSRYNPLEKIKVIAKKKLEEPCPTDCAICQETPKLKDALCTECGHYYCKSCWNTWMDAPTSNKNCPTCRKNMPKTTSYRARASKAKPPGPLTLAARQPIAIVEYDDDEIV